MELILISNTKLKIMLDESDMQQYQIGNEADCAEPTTRRAIRSLLECAREQIGFDTEGSEIFVQLYTSKRGGCELFVTKCQIREPSEESFEEAKDPIPSEKLSMERRGKKSARLPEKPSEEKPRTSVSAIKEESRAIARHGVGGRIAFSFPDLTSLLSVCRILNKAGILPESRAFSDEMGNCFLLLTNTGMSAYARLDKLTFILEYGHRENPDCLASYISEHGRQICAERAIETLCRF